MTKNLFKSNLFVYGFNKPKNSVVILHTERFFMITKAFFAKNALDLFL